MANFTNRLLAVAFGTMLLGQSAEADNWLTPMPDNVYVRSLSIPGTHDSATGDGKLTSIGRTQDLPFGELWDCGIRAFDLRPTVKKDGESYVLHIYHGMLGTNTRFDEALRLLRDKLEESPGEFAIVIMRHESDANAGIQDRWPQLMGECLNSDELAGCLVKFKKNLTLGDVRGKILVMSRDNYNDGPVGAYIRNWSHSDSFNDQKNTTFNYLGTIRENAIVQDFYDCTNGAIDRKKTAITRLLDESARLNGSAWVVNHTSGYTSSIFTAGIQDCAAQTNGLVVDYLADSGHNGSTGIIMMDFAGVDKSDGYDVKGLALTKAVISQNARYAQLTTGISDAGRDSGGVRVSGRVVTCGGLVTACSTDGVTVARGQGGLTLPSKGVYILKTGASSSKVVVD